MLDSDEKMGRVAIAEHKIKSVQGVDKISYSRISSGGSGGFSLEKGVSNCSL